jgi:hypothetical protein
MRKVIYNGAKCSCFTPNNEYTVLDTCADGFMVVIDNDGDELFVNKKDFT